jgi:pimeloyl-ACP methyl ester carboxylesterase
VGSARLGLPGRWQELSFASEALADNPLGDPHERPVYVWTPPSDEPRLTIYILQGFTGTAPAWFNVRPFERSFPEVVEQLAPEANVVLVDAFTAIGGSQFLDAPAIGKYHTYLCDELVPWIDTQFPTNGVRALQGKSSGGYGAMVTAMLRPDLFAGFATHAGDALFDISYRRSFAEAARALRDVYGGSFDRYWEEFRSERPSRSSDHVLLDVWAMSAAYSGGELPFDLDTGEVKDEVWARWLEWDPVRMACEPRYRDPLREMRAIWIDAGRSDEFFLDLGAVAFRRALAEAGVSDSVLHFELHDGGHFGTSWRYPLSLSFLVERLA